MILGIFIGISGTGVALFGFGIIQGEVTAGAPEVGFVGLGLMYLGSVGGCITYALERMA